MCNLELGVLIRALSRSKENIPSIRLFANRMVVLVDVVSVCKSGVIETVVVVHACIFLMFVV